MTDRLKPLATALALLAAAPAGAAGTGDPPAGVSIELSTAEDTEGACRLSFVIVNGLEADIASAVYEAVLFSGQGQVARMTLLDLQELPAGRPRVRQFRFEGLACGDIGRVLINGAHACTGAGLTPAACIVGLRLNSLSDMELVG